MARTKFSGPVESTNGFTGAITGNITGNVTGNVTGNLTGNVTGNVTGNASGTALSITGSLTGDVTSTAMATTVALVGGASAAIVKAASAGKFDVATAANIETSAANGGALSVSKVYSLITSAGAETRTLAAPSVAGQLKIIEMGTYVGDVTLSLANVVGGSAGTTATFGAEGQSLVLISLAAKWLVIGNTAVLS